MADTKNVLRSKTFQGIIGMVVVSLVGVFDISLTDSEVGKIVEALVILGSAGWAIWGRCNADKKLTLGKGQSGLILPLLLVTVMATGCATKTPIEQVAELPGPDQARFYAGELGRTWLDLDEGYRLAWATATPGEKQWMSDNLKPAIQAAKPVVDGAVSAAKAWTVAVRGCPEGTTTAEAESASMSAVLARCEDAESKFHDLYIEALNLLAQAREISNLITSKE